MGRWSSLHEHFVRVKTLMGLERFEVQKFRFWSCFKSAENRARSSLWVGGDRYARIFVYVKTHMGLEQFEVGKSRYSYDFPFKSCLGNGRCRPVNSIAQAKICLRVSRMTQGVIGAIPPGGFGGTGAPPRCRPPSILVRAGGGGLIQKVASMRLKIWQQVALRYAQIAMRGFCARQNFYGFRAIWSQIFCQDKIY